MKIKIPCCAGDETWVLVGWVSPAIEKIRVTEWILYSNGDFKVRSQGGEYCMWGRRAFESKAEAALAAIKRTKEETT